MDGRIGILTIELPFPPAALSGHVNGNGRWAKIGLTKQWRLKAKLLAESAMDGSLALPSDGDIKLHLHYVMPDRRSDRLNCVNRSKSIVDGIADALGVNDRRFLPSISFSGPEKPGKVIVTVGG